MPNHFGMPTTEELAKVEKIRAAAAAMIPGILAERDAKFESFVAAHEADKANFSFRCERFGDFLVVFMARGVPIPVKQVYAINLMTSPIIKPHTGSAPDMKGVATFAYYGGDTVHVVYSEQQQFQIIGVGLDKSNHGFYSRSMLFDPMVSNMRIPDCPRGAWDDTVIFTNSGSPITLYAPAGLGQSMFDQIMLEIRNGVQA